MAHRRWLLPLLVVLVGSVVVLAIAWSVPRLLDGLGYAFSGKSTWQAIERAKPLIQARADAVLRELGHDPTQLSGYVTPVTPGPEFGFGGDEVWLVRYWTILPEDYAQKFMDPGEFRVYLNDQGTVRRVEKGSGSMRELLLGKDRRINDGMTYEEVRERLGEPDLHQPTPQQLRNRGDEVWIYNANALRRATTKVYFRNQRVMTTSGETPVAGSILDKKNREFRKEFRWEFR